MACRSAAMWRAVAVTLSLLLSGARLSSALYCYACKPDHHAAGVGGGYDHDVELFPPCSELRNALLWNWDLRNYIQYCPPGMESSCLSISDDYGYEKRGCSSSSSDRCEYSSDYREICHCRRDLCNTSSAVRPAVVGLALPALILAIIQRIFSQLA